MIVQKEFEAKFNICDGLENGIKNVFYIYFWKCFKIIMTKTIKRIVTDVCCIYGYKMSWEEKIIHQISKTEENRMMFIENLT